MIDPTFCGSRFSTARLLSLKNLTFTIIKIHNNKNSIVVSMNNFSMNKSDCGRKYTFVSDLPMPINSHVCCDKNILKDIKCDILYMYEK